MSHRRTTRLVALTAVLAGLAAPASAAASVLDSRPGDLTRRSARIVNGYTPHPSQWPWMAALTVEAAGASPLERQFCGGTLIAPTIVLTAAHCVVFRGETLPPELVQIVLGRRNLDADAGEVIDVTAITPHPLYRRAGVNSYDVALVDLARPSVAQPAAFVDPTVVVPEGTRATVMGWGQTGPRRRDPKSGDLLAADLPLWSGQRCNVAYGRRLHVPSAVCAGYMDGRVDSCPGDSGGGLMVRDAAGGWRLIGVVSYGPDCGTARIPGVYAWVNALEVRRFLATRLPGISTEPPPASRIAPAALRVVGTVRGGARVRLRYRLERAATVRIGVFRRREERLIQVGRSVRHRGGAGRNTLVITSRQLGRRLPRGRYVVIAVAGARGAASALQYAALRVAR